MFHSIKKLIPPSFLDYYHFLQGVAAAYYYGFPANDLICIGVTGTKGKTTTCSMIAAILEKAGEDVGLSSTVNFQIGKKKWMNKTKMTSVPPFQMQKLLRDIKDAGCKYAVLEISSHAIQQHRVYGIPFQVAVFTNIAEEHIEYHGNFIQYKKAKGELFALLKKTKYVAGGKKTSIVNLDDRQAQFFLSFPCNVKYGYTVQDVYTSKLKDEAPFRTVTAQATSLELHNVLYKIKTPEGDFDLRLKILGIFNVYNALAAVSCTISLGVDLETIKKALEEFKGVPGRMEEINMGQDFKVIVDYAHTPDSLHQVYETIASFPHNKIISVLGSCGDRDKEKRPVMGSLAAKFCNIVIVTNEDPYFEDPEKIIDEVLEGAEGQGKRLNKNLFRISDRGDAIKRAIELVEENDVVIITGKGCEQCIVVDDRKIPWDDRKVVREEIRKLGKF